jgi:hypothetical protein
MGTGKDRKNALEIFRMVVEMCEQAYFGHVYTIKDYELTPELEGRFNLILVGNSKSNSAWSRLADALPVELNRDSVRMGRKSWTGDALGLEAIVPNPLYPQKAIVLVGVESPMAVRLPQVNIALDGWYSYCVWSCSGEGVKVLSFGDWHEKL